MGGNGITSRSVQASFYLSSVVVGGFEGDGVVAVLVVDMLEG